MTLTDEILAYACRLGFAAAGVIPAGPAVSYARFTAWLAAGYAGEMDYLAHRMAERRDPRLLLPTAASLIVLVQRYDGNPAGQRAQGEACGRFARYAWGPDYHDSIRRKLYALDAFIRAATGRQEPGKACVDTAPLLERDFACQAGLGFFGRNTCLITPPLGSWTFLAALVVPEKLETGIWRSETSAATRSSDRGCGRCTRCLDACPTGAFVAPYVLDARRCIAYLTIELRGPIPRALREGIGHWVFGCDVCQEVCPYNQAAARRNRQAAPGQSEPEETAWLPLGELLALDEARFRARFRGTAVWRAKRRGLLRNACVVAGNIRNASLIPGLAALLADEEPLVRGHAAWALGQIGGREALKILRTAYDHEQNSWVGEEMALAIGRI